MITIRRATHDDLDALIEGNQGVAFETEALELNEVTLRSGITAILDDVHKGMYWVAEINAQVVGQTLITYEWSDWRCAPIWWLQSVYVWPQFRGQGVFRHVLAHIEREANAAGAKDIRLYADTTNDTARATYQKLGFTTGHYQVFEKPLSD